MKRENAVFGISCLVFLLACSAVLTYTFLQRESGYEKGIVASEIIAEAVPEEIGEKININTADKETLMALDGIGETIAERIIVYRSENGGFSSPEELSEVEGIGEKKLMAIIGKIIL